MLSIPHDIDPCIENICLNMPGQALNVPSASQKLDSLSCTCNFELLLKS